MAQSKKDISLNGGKPKGRPSRKPPARLAPKQYFEEPVIAKEACKITGWGNARMSAIKSAMGIKNQRWFYLSDVKRFLRENPSFKETDIYPKKAHNGQSKASKHSPKSSTRKR